MSLTTRSLQTTTLPSRESLILLDALEKANNDPEVKNFVIDISTNGGGSVDIDMMITSLLANSSVLYTENTMTRQRAKTTYVVDRNFDGKFDDKDVSPYTDYNFGVLTSNYAFSCGNAYPWFMHENGCAIMGQKTSGGACAIRLSSSAGVEFACSAASSRIVSKSGENVDFGCPVDYDLISENENPYENFYDLSILSGKMNDFYSK
jgi:C-terminal processing protease CtpA/Prc